MKKSKFIETFSEIPGIYELPKKIYSVFESNKGVAEKYFWQANLLQTFEKICILLAKISIYEYKNSPFAKKSNQLEGSPAYKLERGLNKSAIFGRRDKLSFGDYNQISSATAKCLRSNREYSQTFVSAIWLDKQASQTPWTNYNLLCEAIISSLPEIESHKLSIKDAFDQKKESFEKAGNKEKNSLKQNLISFLGVMSQTRNKNVHANDKGAYWPMTEEYLELSLELLKPCLESLINELSPLWKYQVCQITKIHPQGLEVCADNGTQHELVQKPENLSLNLNDEILLDPTSNRVVADLELSKFLYLSPYVEAIMEKKALELRKANDVEEFKKAVRTKLEDDHVIDLAEKRELESVGWHNLEFNQEETEKIILEVAKSEGIEEPFAKFDPAFNDILDEAIKSGSMDELSLSLQAKTYGLNFGDFKKSLRDRAYRLGKNLEELTHVVKKLISTEDLSDARCLTEICCWLRDLNRLNAEKSGLYESGSGMHENYETRTGKHKRIFGEVRDMLANRVARLQAGTHWETKVNQWNAGNMVGYLWCQSYNTKKTVGYKKKLDGRELHLILWAKHHNKDTAIALSEDSDWGFLRLGVGYTNDLMPGGTKYDSKKFDYPLYERIVSEKTKETIREYFDAFSSHPDLYLFNHSLNPISSRDEMLPVAELDPHSGKLDDYFRHNPGLKTLRFVNQWPLLKKDPVQVLSNLDNSFLLLNEMLVDIERDYELCIRKSGGKPSSCFHGLVPTLRGSLDDVRKELPKKLIKKIKEDRPKSGMGSRFVDSISINKTGERGLVELTYGFWQGEKENEVLCGFDARTALRSRPLSEEELYPEDDILYQFAQSFSESKRSIRDWRTQRYLDNLDYFFEPNHLSFRITLTSFGKSDFNKIAFQEALEKTLENIKGLLEFKNSAFTQLF
jgi:hypothetical protein